MSKFIPQGMGWFPDLPDARDYTTFHKKVRQLLRRLKRDKQPPPITIDLRQDEFEEVEYFTIPEDQGALNCSCAFAVLSLIEYFERRARGRTFEGSKLFLYKITRNRMQKWLRATGDTGTDLRTTLKVLAQFGVSPEEHWPFDPENYNAEPNAFQYTLATRFRGFRYVRLDHRNCHGNDTLSTVKSFLAARIPIAFGFPVPTSLTNNGFIPYRPLQDSWRGGQAVVAVGYDDNRNVLLIRSSWGSHWGDVGCGWLPYTYVKEQLARDFWICLSKDWLDPSEFLRPSVIDAESMAST